MIVISGASNNHFKSLCNFTNSFMKSKQSHKLVIYDLGIDKHLWESFQNHFGGEIEYRRFNFSCYPSWYDISIEAGQYAWKSAIIKDVHNSYSKEIIVWMDSGNLIHTLEPIYNFLLTNGIYSATSGGDILRWTHINTIKYFEYKEVNKPNRNGACIGFNTNFEYACNILNDFAKYCSLRECIAPDGSSRKNHRQDQAVFTILYYIYHHKYNFLIENRYYICWQLYL